MEDILPTRSLEMSFYQLKSPEKICTLFPNVKYNSPVILVRSFNYYIYSKDYIVDQVENSLQNLKMHFLDLLLLYRPSPIIQSDKVNAAIYQLITQGKIKAIGVSNFTPYHIDLIQENHPIVYNQIECSLSHYQPLYDGTLDYLTKIRLE